MPDKRPHLAPQSRYGSPLQNVVAGAVVRFSVQSVGVRAIGLAKCRGVEIRQKQQRSKGNNKAGQESIRESRSGPRRLPPTRHITTPSVFFAQSFGCRRDVSRLSAFRAALEIARTEPRKLFCVLG